MPWPSNPFFSRFPCFCCFPISLAFLCVFPFFSKDFRGSAKRKTLVFFGVSLAFFSSCVLGFFARGVFQKMPALEGQFPKEISVRFAGENHLRTQKKHKTKLCAEVPERPLPKDPFFQLLNFFQKKKKNKGFSESGSKKPWQPETWQDSTLLFSTWKSGKCLHILGRCPYSIAPKPGEKGKNPLETIQKKPVQDGTPRNCRFLSLVVVERVLTEGL